MTDAYIFALSGGNTEISSYVHDGLGAYRMVVFFPYLDNSRLERLTRDEIPSILDKHLAGVPDVSAKVSGVTVLWANMDNAMSRGQIASVLIMAVACFVTFFLSLRNWTLAANAMFVNVLPVAIVAAILGATGGRSTWRRSSSWASRWGLPSTTRASSSTSTWTGSAPRERRAVVGAPPRRTDR